MNLVPADSPILRQVASDVELHEIASVAKITHDMFNVMRANGGVALAAPQIGISKKIIVIDHNNLVLVNPVITPIVVQSMYAQSSTFKLKEGCLSLPNVQVEMDRHLFVRVEYVDCVGYNAGFFKQHSFVAHGLYSAILQHEYDHLLGKLIID